MFYQLEHIGMMDFFKKEEGENFNYPLHLHQSFELIYLEEGEMAVTVNNTLYNLQKNEMLLIFPNQIHSIQSTISKHTLFIFSPHIIQTFFMEKNGKLPQSNRLSLPDDYIQMLKTLSSESSIYQIKGLLYLICDLFDKQNKYYDSMSNKENSLSKILLYIENNFRGPCSIVDISKNTLYSPEYISRLFKKNIGISCKYYITARRLSYATYLLSRTDTTCISCALECGFNSLRSFNRNFKSYLNLSPMEYRAKMRNSV